MKATKKKPKDHFTKWWDNFGKQKVSKIKKEWIEKNSPNTPDSIKNDFWQTNRIMHQGDPHKITRQLAKEAYEKGLKGEDWQIKNSLNCELNNVLNEAYQASLKIHIINIARKIKGISITIY